MQSALLYVKPINLRCFILQLYCCTLLPWLKRKCMNLLERQNITVDSMCTPICLYISPTERSWSWRILLSYKEHNNENWWYISDGKKQSDITEIFRSWSWNNLKDVQNGWVTVERATAKTFCVILRPSVNDNLQNIVACGGSTTFSCGLICLENDLIRWILLERCDRRICDKTMIARMAKMRLKMKVVKSTSLQPSPEPPAQDQ